MMDTQTPDPKPLRDAALALYKPPFKFQRGYVFDAASQMVADQDGWGEGSKVYETVAARVRGWGRIVREPDAAALQDEVGTILADALTEFWNRAASPAAPQPLSDELAGEIWRTPENYGNPLAYARAIQAAISAPTVEPGAVPVGRIIELKTDPDPFDAVASGVKTHEIRRNDRDYKVGDTLVLRKTRYTGDQMHCLGKPLQYTGETVRRTVTHIQDGYGLDDHLVILSLAASPLPQQAVQTTVRMLTRQEFVDAARSVLGNKPLTPSNADFHVNDAAMRKFCEVNGLTLATQKEPRDA